MDSSDQEKTPPRPGKLSGGGSASVSGTSEPATMTMVSASPSSQQQLSPTDEAAAVLEAIGGESHLNGFNLLGVVANPRGTSSSMMSSSPGTYHGRYNDSRTPASPAHPSAAVEASSSTDVYHTLEMTLSQVTEQMEALNSVLEDWSRQILEDPYPYNDDQPPESMLTELPYELRNLNLQSLQSYLESSGVKAHGFQQRRQHRLNEEAQLQQKAILTVESQQQVGEEGAIVGGKGGETLAATAPTTDVDAATATCVEIEGEIPSRFFQTDFDLTDPETFRELLLLKEEDEDGSDHHDDPMGVSSRSTRSERNASGDGVVATVADAAVAAKDPSAGPVVVNTDLPVHEWFPLPPQDTFGTFLDKVELALLLQVRSKSGAFFEESLRFAQLQEMIQSLLAQVITMQDVMRHLQQDLVEPMEVIPESDSQRADLQEILSVLELADEMLQCRSSIGGLLASQDDLTAINQIQYGRNLLSGKAHEQADEGDDGRIAKKNMELRRLHALKSVWDQLNQYELLVVTNLREEIVEIFLGWNTSAVSSIYSSTSPTSGNKCSPQVQQRVREIFGALRQCRALPETRDAYNNRLQEVIRMTVRTTVGEFASDASSEGTNNQVVAVSTGATAMNLDRFLDCLDMLFEQLLASLTSASGVDEFCVEEKFTFDDTSSPPDNTKGPMAAVITSAAELSSKSISELLRLRKEAHSLVTLVEMKRIWDKCFAFASQVEDLSGHKASALRSTLQAQAKAFVERKHESNMSALVAALESERWTQCEVSTERQAAVTRLCVGRSLASPASRDAGEEATSVTQKSPVVEVEGRRYKVVWSCLLLVEMVINDIAAASHFPSLASSIVAKVSELLRLFNSRTTQLVLGAGAIHSAARLKSINAKHLSLVTQCLGMITAILPHVRAGLMLQLPQKQHTLLSSIDQIKKEYADHNEKVLNKFVTIIGGIVEHGLAPKIKGTDFDVRAKIQPNADGNVSCCIFLEGVSTNTRKMHQVLASLLPPDHLQDVFSRIFAFIDKTVPTLFVAAAEAPRSVTGGDPRSPPGTKQQPTFFFPKTDEGKRRLLLEVEVMTKNLNGLDGVQPWDFTVTTILGRSLEYQLNAEEGSADEVDNKDEELQPSENEAATENGESAPSAMEEDKEATQEADNPAEADEKKPPGEAHSETGSEVTADTPTAEPPESPKASTGNGEAAEPGSENDAPGNNEIGNEDEAVTSSNEETPKDGDEIAATEAAPSDGVAQDDEPSKPDDEDKNTEADPGNSNPAENTTL